jgi:hypothetical protein
VRIRSEGVVNADELRRFFLSQPLKEWNNMVVVEMPDDKSRYAVKGVRIDHDTKTIVIEVA